MFQLKILSSSGIKSVILMQVKRSGKKLKKLEAVRGFASVYVVLHHLPFKGFTIAGFDVSILFRFGQEAVILFFLLSGFVIHYAFFLSADKSFRTFFSKRFLRIYIPLICVLITTYTIVALQAHKWEPINWRELAGNLMMLQDSAFLKPNVIVSPFMHNMPLWSLSYEWWFYMLFFAVTTRIHKKPSLVVYITGIIAAVTYVIYPNFINRELMYMIIWWAGTDMALLYLNKGRFNMVNLKNPLIAICITCVILIINIKLHNHNVPIGRSPFLELRHFAFALMTILIAILWKKLNWFGFKFTLGLFEKIAPISFGIFLSGYILIDNATYLNGSIDNVFLKFGAYTLICLLFAYIVERVIYVKINLWVMSKINKKQPVK